MKRKKSVKILEKTELILAFSRLMHTLCLYMSLHEESDVVVFLISSRFSFVVFVLGYL